MDMAFAKAAWTMPIHDARLIRPLAVVRTVDRSLILSLAPVVISCHFRKLLLQTEECVWRINVRL